MSQSQGEAILAAAQELSVALNAEGGELSTKIQAVIDVLSAPDANLTAAQTLLADLQVRVTKLSDLVPVVGAPTTETAPEDSTPVVEQ